MVKCYGIFIFGAFLFFQFENGNAKQCYSCTTLKTNKCEDPFNVTSAETVTCNEPGYGCMKQILPATGASPRVIHRGCTPKFYCSTLSSASEHCTVCEIPLCNSSSVLGPSLVVVLFVLAKTWIGF